MGLDLFPQAKVYFLSFPSSIRFRILRVRCNRTSPVSTSQFLGQPKQMDGASQTPDLFHVWKLLFHSQHLCENVKKTIPSFLSFVNPIFLPATNKASYRSQDPPVEEGIPKKQ